MRNPAKEWKSREDKLKEINIPQMEDKLTLIRTTEFKDPRHNAAIEDLLIMIVTHLQSEEIV